MPIHDPTQMILLPEPAMASDDAERLARARRRIAHIMSELDGAPRMPWTEAECAARTAQITAMSKWFAADEGEAIRARFAAAVAALARHGAAT